MAQARLKFHFPSLEPPQPSRPEPMPESRCEICGGRAPFIYRAPGFDGFRSAGTARCFAHSHLGGRP